MNLQAPSGRNWYRIRWSESHWMHSAFAVVAIGMYILAGISHTRVSGLPSDFPLEQLNYPIVVGQYTVHSEPELLARVAGERLHVAPPAGARWASSTGCGTTIEGEEDKGLRVACGMGHTPEISRRFLYFFGPA